MTRPLNALVLGGCLLREPVRSVHNLEARLVPDRYGTAKTMHSVAEMIQFVEFLKGRKEVPPEMRSLTGVSPQMKPLPAGHDFHDLDLVLAEPGSPVDITFRGFAVNRTRINRLLGSVDRLEPQARDLAWKWVRRGLMEMNEDARKDLSTKLLEYIPEDDDAGFRRAVIAETFATKSDVAGGLKELRELTNRPMGVVIFTFRYMPDGRPISWPAGSREAVIAAARALDLPHFDATPLVQQFGVSVALDEDQQHYKEEFLPVAGNAIIEFAQRVYAQSNGAMAG